MDAKEHAKAILNGSPDAIIPAGNDKRRSIMEYIDGKKDLLKAVACATFFVANSISFAHAQDTVGQGVPQSASVPGAPSGIDTTDAANLSTNQLQTMFRSAMSVTMAMDYMRGLPGASEGYVAVDADSGTVLDAMKKQDQNAVREAVAKSHADRFQGAYPTRVSYISSVTKKRTTVGALFFKQPSFDVLSEMQQTLAQNRGKYDDSTFMAFAQSIGYANALGESDIHGMKTARSDTDIAKEQVFACIIETQKGFPMVTDMTMDMYRSGVFAGVKNKELVLRALADVKKTSITAFMKKTPEQLAEMSRVIVKNAASGADRNLREAPIADNMANTTVIRVASSDIPPPGSAPDLPSTTQTGGAVPPQGSAPQPGAVSSAGGNQPAGLFQRAKGFVSQSATEIQNGNASQVQDQVVSSVKSTLSKMGF